MERLGSRDGTVARALASHQFEGGQSMIPAMYHMWLQFAIGSRSYSEGFSHAAELPGFPPSRKKMPIPVGSG